MTHYEPQDSVRRKDEQAIEAVLTLNEDALFRRVNDMNITMCGYAPTIVMLVASKLLGAKSAEMVKYQTSGDITGDNSSVVGYAGVIVTPTEVAPIVKLAKRAVETYVRQRKIIPPPARLTPEMMEKPAHSFPYINSMPCVVVSAPSSQPKKI